MKRLLLILIIALFGACTKKQTSILSTSGKVTTINFTGSIPADFGFTGLAVDESGNVYISEGWNKIVCKVNPSGIISTIAGNGNDKGIGDTGGYYGNGGPATAAQLGYISGLAVDKEGNVYISDETNNCILKVNSLGIINSIIESPLSLCITGVAVNGSNVYFASGCNNTIYEGNNIIAGNGNSSLTASGGYNSGYPTGVAVDGSGNVYIADASNVCVRKVTPSGTISNFAGNGKLGNSGDGGAATAAEISGDIDIAVDGLGNVYISDAVSGCIRKVNPSGIISTVVGNYYGGSIAVDSSGNIYIVEKTQILIISK